MRTAQEEDISFVLTFVTHREIHYQKERRPRKRNFTVTGKEQGKGVERKGGWEWAQGRKEGKDERGNLPGQGSSEPRLHEKQEVAVEDQKFREGLSDCNADAS